MADAFRCLTGERFGLLPESRSGPLLSAGVERNQKVVSLVVYAGPRSSWLLHVLPGWLSGNGLIDPLIVLVCLEVSIELFHATSAFSCPLL